MRLPLHKAMQAVYLVTSSKKGISAHQLHRTLEITYKSAWKQRALRMLNSRAPRRWRKS